MSRVNGMAAYNSHKEPSKEMLKIWEKNGSLSDYQNKKQDKQKEISLKEELDYINKMFL